MTDHARPFIGIRPWLRAGLLRHLSPTASRILLLLVDYCGTDGYSYPSAKRLAALSGHERKTVYAALKELVALGCIQRKDGADGRTRFSAGHRHPGPVYYWIGEFDAQAERRFRQVESRSTRQGRAARITRRKMSLSEEHLTEAKMSLSQEHLNGERCSCADPQDVPGVARQDVPADARQDVPEPGTYRALGQSLRTEPFQSTPPSPPTGGTPTPGGPDAGALSSPAGNGQEGTDRGTAKAQKARESVRKFFEAETTLGKGLKPLPEYLGWFPMQYSREMIREVYAEARARQQAEQGDAQ